MFPKIDINMMPSAPRVRHPGKVRSLTGIKKAYEMGVEGNGTEAKMQGG
jgi:hypothetical protein